MHKKLDLTKIKSAAALGLTDIQLEKLIVVRNDLAKMKVRKTVKAVRQSPFNMSYAALKPLYSCGTVACIGGWMTIMEHMPEVQHIGHVLVPAEVISKVDNFVYGVQDRNEELYNLFFPYSATEGQAKFSDVQPYHCVKAIDSYLYTGKADWSHARKILNKE